MTTYRERQRQKAQAVAEAEREVIRATRAHLLKLNALARARGEPAAWVVPPDPDVTPATPAGGPRLGVVDLRGKVMPVVLRGKRGRCQECKAKLTSRRGWFCDPCKARRARDKRYGR
jgi:hypothetical protein